MPRCVMENVETIQPVKVKDIILTGSATGFPIAAGAVDTSPVYVETSDYKKIAETILTPGSYTLKMIIQCDAGTTGQIRVYDYTGKLEIMNFIVTNENKQIATKSIIYNFTQPDNIVELHAKRNTGLGSVWISVIKIEKV